LLWADINLTGRRSTRRAVRILATRAIVGQRTASREMASQAAR
jgi:hypothetical protein